MKQTSMAVLAAASLLAASSSLFAGEASPASGKQPQIVPPSEFPYVSGANEVDFGLSGFWSIGTAGNARRPNMSYGLAQLDYGWMLSDVQGSGFFRGNSEFLVGAFGGPTFKGPGSGLVGSEMFLRYNFVQPEAHLVPFAQLGGGGVYSDAAHSDGVQRLLGAPLSFDLETALGLRWMFSPHCALSFAVEFRHFSNAGTASRNQGLNSVGGVLGVSYFLGGPGH